MMFATPSVTKNTITTSTYNIQIYPLLNSRSFGYIFSLLESKISLFLNKRLAFAGEKQPWKAHLKFSRLHQRGTGNTSLLWNGNATTIRTRGQWHAHFEYKPCTSYYNFMCYIIQVIMLGINQFSYRGSICFINMNICEFRQDCPELIPRESFLF